jgi:hypothetical protein
MIHLTLYKWALLPHSLSFPSSFLCSFEEAFHQAAPFCFRRIIVNIEILLHQPAQIIPLPNKCAYSILVYFIWGLIGNSEGFGR